jgi:hypothetical protein
MTGKAPLIVMPPKKGEVSSFPRMRESRSGAGFRVAAYGLARNDAASFFIVKGAPQAHEHSRVRGNPRLGDNAAIFDHSEQAHEYFSIFSIYYDGQTQEKTSGELAQWWQEGHHETHQSSPDVRNR